MKKQDKYRLTAMAATAAVAAVCFWAYFAGGEAVYGYAFAAASALLAVAATAELFAARADGSKRAASPLGMMRPALLYVFAAAAAAMAVYIFIAK